MTRGRIERDGIYRQFRQDVLGAQAEARATAEIQVYRENPLAWLGYGPGRSKPEVPGWTDRQCDVEETDRLQSFRPANSPESTTGERCTTHADFLHALEEYGFAVQSSPGRDLLAATHDTQ
jgi:hypothetical protein